jgi:2-oxoglutarate ferredoxin oxidoreductase subunit gamma
MTRQEIRISGLGGQGIITLGYVLGQACLLDEKNALQTQSYGPEARGSVCRTEVVLSDNDIFYPKVAIPDILVVMSQEAYKRFRENIKEDGFLIIDSTLVETEDVPSKVKSYTVSAIETAKTLFENPIMANLIMLGALTAITGVVSKEAVEKSISKRWSNAETNLKAFRKGLELGKIALEEKSQS